jgi:hypothetical protein
LSDKAEIAAVIEELFKDLDLGWRIINMIWDNER